MVVNEDAGALQVRQTASLHGFDEWIVEFDKNSPAWVVMLYKKDVPRRGIKAGDYMIEVFTTANSAEPNRPMNTIEIALFKLALIHNLVEEA